MSAMPRISDITRTSGDVRDGPLADYSPLTAFQIASVIDIGHRPLVPALGAE
jgi:hypothetical protein